MSRSVRFFLSVVLILTMGALAFGQSTKGTVAGVITDSSGAVVANASVTVTSDANGETHTTATSATGEYRVEALIPGTYTVTVEGQGFAKTEVEGVDQGNGIVSDRSTGDDLSPRLRHERRWRN